MCLVGFPVLCLAGLVVGDECARRKQLSEVAKEAKEAKEAINVETNTGQQEEEKRNEKIEKRGSNTYRK